MPHIEGMVKKERARAHVTRTHKRTTHHGAFDSQIYTTQVSAVETPIITSLWYPLCITICASYIPTCI